MGHYFSGVDKEGKEIVYAHFHSSNYFAIDLYHLLDANDKNGGVSGIFDSAIYTQEQLEKAKRMYKQNLSNERTLCESDIWDKQQILQFIERCLDVARKEGTVKVLFC
ncbi:MULTISPECIES: hypothetical protein [Sutcliffiella]|uniref:hypothetical protein n=1 Tax=Sutcliffiella TaxID=2837511 RepID=UPI0022DE2D1E|nr:MULTISPECIES: hypothetical protein [Sutcliffiella]MED4017621.1 hypothetical protein [Sutcliffiella cohnii]WBL15365.1 hypothetical protein O1A01_01505 [Sutcliffiella sp. NC1]